jgi:hypothetical protein
MSDNDERLTPEVELFVLEARIAFWRGQARDNLILGFFDLARICETAAASLEWDEVPCAK